MKFKCPVCGSDNIRIVAPALYEIDERGHMAICEGQETADIGDFVVPPDMDCQECDASTQWWLAVSAEA